MTTNTKRHHRHHRFFRRQSCQNRLGFTCPELGGSMQQEGRLRNKGAGGVCFESGQYLRPGTRICLFLDEPASEPATDGSQMQTFYLATVQWCNRLQSAPHPSYGVGVQFVSNECEWCGEIVPYEQIHCIQSRAILCEACLRDLEEFNSGRLKLSLVDHLLGNVI
jgi:hypothetical protein